MATDSRSRGPRHWRGTQKSHRSGGAPTGRRSVAYPHRPSQRRNIGINQLVKFEGNRKENTPKETLKPLWNVAAARYLTCSESPRERRLRLGAPKFLFHADRIDQIAAATAVACTDRSTSRWKQNQRAKRKRKRPRENFNHDYKPYDLTSHLHPRPPYLTSYIVVRSVL